MISSILKNPEWAEVEQMLKEEFLDGKKPINFKTDGKSNEQIASEARARELSAKAIKMFLNKINKLKNPIEVKRKSYK